MRMTPFVILSALAVVTITMMQETPPQKKPVATVAPLLEIKTQPLGSEIHEILRSNGYLVTHVDRSTGIVVWKNGTAQVFGRFAGSESAVFDRRVMRIAMERDGQDVWTVDQVAVEGSKLLIDRGNGWQLALTAVPSIPKPRKPLANDEQTIKGWRVKIAPVSEGTRRKIYYDICYAQDHGTGDEEAYVVVAKRYGIKLADAYAIAGEGAVKNWPIPPLP